MFIVEIGRIELGLDISSLMNELSRTTAKKKCVRRSVNLFLRTAINFSRSVKSCINLKNIFTCTRSRRRNYVIVTISWTSWKSANVSSQ